MKNSDYTCDLCHAQVYERDLYVLDLGRMVATRTGASRLFRYDLCEKCAKLVNEKVNRQFGVGVDE